MFFVGRRGKLVLDFHRVWHENLELVSLVFWGDHSTTRARMAEFSAVFDDPAGCSAAVV